MTSSTLVAEATQQPDGSPPDVPSRRRDVAGVGAIVALGALTGVPVSGFVSGAAPVAVSLGVSVVAALAAWTVCRSTDRVGWSRARTVVALLAIGLVGGGVVAVGVAGAWPGPSAGRSSAVRAASTAMIDGWSAVATSPVPADPAPGVLVPLALVAWSAVWAGVVLRLRAGAPLGCTVPGVVAVVTASVAAGGRSGAPVLVGLGLVAAVALAVTTADRGPQLAVRATGAPIPPGRRSTIGATVAIVVIGGVFGVVLGPSLTLGRDDDPFDPRELLQTAPDLSDSVNPIELVASWMQRDAVMFTVESEVPVGTRLVVLDSFDGARWQTSARYEPTGTRLAAPPRDDVDVREVVATIDPVELTGPWLATISDTVTIEGVDVRFDPRTQMIVAVGEADDPYEVRALVPRFDDPGIRARLSDLPTLHADDAPASSAPLPDPPAWIAEMAAAATAGSTSPFEQALRLERYLRTSFSRRDQPMSGHSYGQLERALLWDESGAASAEQFAATFATVGRSIGLPTRVVVGFAPGDEVRPGVREVRAEDVRVWPEVRFASIGWVPFEPTPGAESTLGGAGGGDDLGVGSGDAGDLPPPNDDEPSGPDGGADGDTPDDVGPADGAGTADAPAPESTRWRTFAVGAVVLVALVVLLPVAVVVAKRRRSARRRRQDSDVDRVIGAWHDVRDRLTELGVVDTERVTVEEIVAGAGARAEALTGIYRPVNAALYGPASVTAEDADQAWRARDRFVDVTRRDLSWSGRLRCAIDPRPLRRPRRRDRRSPQA